MTQTLIDGRDVVDPAAIAAAVVSMMSDAPPLGESTAPVPGSAPRVTREGHQHGRLTSATYATVTAGSTASVTFTYQTADGMLGFVNKPGMVMAEIEGDNAATSQPAIFKVQSWIVDGTSGRYTGAVIKVWRAQTLPQNLATLLLGAVFNLFTASVIGTQFSCVAVKRSDVS